MNIRLRYLALCILLPMHSSMLWASEWQTKLSINPVAGQLFMIELPEDTDIITLTRLVVEVNGIDVTAFLSLQDNNFFLCTRRAFATRNPYSPVSDAQSGW
ncbi:hypothetical protein [Nitrincola sp. A-D6]|uniref:hypothetical protein n=1 Tax=Nitrincola sp. A-D6 TaxID=1545442 RepID=UPI001186ED96|nr:hypothetical protein [Nitrincola sp. A-D6]